MTQFIFWVRVGRRGGGLKNIFCVGCVYPEDHYNWYSGLVTKWCGKCDPAYVKELSCMIYGTFSLTNPQEEV